MAQTHVSVYLHIIFSTKHRVNLIAPETEDELFAYIGGIIGSYKSKLLIAGGTSNHVHLLISMDKHILIPDLIGKIKRDSSKWIKTKDARYSAFGWQDGYAAFSVGHTQIETVKQYIANQKAHHAQKVFEDELRAFFRKYQIQYDEQYVWD